MYYGWTVWIFIPLINGTVSSILCMHDDGWTRSQLYCRVSLFFFLLSFCSSPSFVDHVAGTPVLCNLHVMRISSLRQFFISFLVFEEREITSILFAFISSRTTLLRLLFTHSAEVYLFCHSFESTIFYFNVGNASSRCTTVWRILSSLRLGFRPPCAYRWLRWSLQTISRTSVWVHILVTVYYLLLLLRNGQLRKVNSYRG